MNVDKLKTIALIALFTISIFLIQQLLVDIQYSSILPFADEEVDNDRSNYILSDIISPRRYVVTYSKNNHTVVYYDNVLWNKSKDLLENVFNNDEKIEISEIDNETYKEYKYRKSLSLQFPQSIPTYALAKMLDIHAPGPVQDKITLVNEIYISLGTEPFVVFNNGSKIFKIDNIDWDIGDLVDRVDGFREQDKYNRYYYGKILLGTGENVFAPINMENVFHDIYLKDQLQLSELDELDNMASRFFDVDIDYVRRVEENNGSIIYMYGSKNLVFSEAGILKYFNIVDQPIGRGDFYNGLSTAVEFITEKDGWPNNAYFVGSQAIEYKGAKGFRFMFSYKIDDYPLISNKNLSAANSGSFDAPIEIEVFNNKITSYKRYIRNIEKYSDFRDNEILSPEEVISKNISFIKSQYTSNRDITGEDIDISNILSSIKKIVLGYYDPADEKSDQRLHGVWMINIDNIDYVFDVRDGDILNYMSAK